MQQVEVSRTDFRDDRLALFWPFVAERQRIWHRRFVEGRPPPWTDDPILRRYRFTNVYRELDPGTRYVIEQVLVREAPKADRIFNVMLYRLIGRSATHAALGFQDLDHFNAADLEERLHHLRDHEPRPLFTAAYMVSAYVSMGSRDKVTNISRLFGVIHERFPRFAQRLMAASTAADAYEVLRSAPGFGNFLAYQVLVDLLYPLVRRSGDPLLPLSHDDWAIAGPGARRGIGMLLRPERHRDTLAVMRWLREQQRAEFARYEIDFPYLRDPDGREVEISLANTQNCLCEFHKRVKIAEGTGRSRRTFPLGMATVDAP